MGDFTEAFLGRSVRFEQLFTLIFLMMPGSWEDFGTVCRHATQFFRRK
jgi:hypothetical protein